MTQGTCLVKDNPVVVDKGTADCGCEEAVSRKRRLKVASSGQEGGTSSQSGPWSVEWLHNIQYGDVGLISSKKEEVEEGFKGWWWHR